MNAELQGLSFFEKMDAIAKQAEESGDDACFDEFEMCDKHGKYQSYKDWGHGKITCINPSCPVCRAERRAVEIIGKAGIQKRFLNCIFDNYEVKSESQLKAKNKVKSYADNFPAVFDVGSSMILSGTVGTGKTHLACAVANQLALNGRTSCLRTVSELVQSVRDSWNRLSAKSSVQIIDEYVEFDLLIIDEFGVQSGTDNELNIIFDIVNARYADQKPIMALTNLSEVDFKKKVGERIFDRLTHKGVFLTMNWNSYRAEG